MTRPSREQIEAAREYLLAEVDNIEAERLEVAADHIRTLLDATAPPTDEHHLGEGILDMSSGGIGGCGGGG